MSSFSLRGPSCAVLSFTAAFLNVTCLPGTGCDLTVWWVQPDAGRPCSTAHFAFPSNRKYSSLSRGRSAWTFTKKRELWSYGKMFVSQWLFWVDVIVQTHDNHLMDGSQNSSHSFSGGRHSFVGCMFCFVCHRPSHFSAWHAAPLHSMMHRWHLQLTFSEAGATRSALKACWNLNEVKSLLLQILQTRFTSRTMK